MNVDDPLTVFLPLFVELCASLVSLSTNGCAVCLLLFQVRNGHIKRITDNDIQSLVLEIEGTNVR